MVGPLINEYYKYYKYNEYYNIIVFLSIVKISSKVISGAFHFRKMCALAE